MIDNGVHRSFGDAGGQVERFQFEDSTVAYEREGSGSPVLFIHNGGTSRRIWREQCRSMASEFDTIAVDLPGFGDSPLPSRKLDFDRYVETVEALIESLGVAPLAIVGNCMGSNIAAAIAAKRPEWVSALVLINPLTETTFSAGQIGVLHKMERWMPGPTRLLRRASRAVVLPSVAAKTALRFQVGRVGASKGIHKDPELVACNRRDEQMRALVDILDDMEAYGRLDRSGPGVPICTIWGAQNRVLSAKSGERLNDVLKPGRSEVIDGCGHLVMLENPDVVTGIIVDFLDSTLPANRDKKSGDTERTPA